MTGMEGTIVEVDIMDGNQDLFRLTFEIPDGVEVSFVGDSKKVCKYALALLDTCDIPWYDCRISQGDIPIKVTSREGLSVWTPV